MRRLLFLVVLICIAPALADNGRLIAVPPSKPPVAMPSVPASPSSEETRQEPKYEVADSQQTADPDQRGTEGAPLVVKVLPNFELQESPDHNAKKNYLSAMIKWWPFSDWPTDVWLAIFIFCLILVGVLQLIVFRVQAVRLRETIKAVRELAATQAADTQDLLKVARDNAIAASSQATAMQQLHEATAAQARPLRRQAIVALAAARAARNNAVAVREIAAAQAADTQDLLKVVRDNATAAASQATVIQKLHEAIAVLASPLRGQAIAALAAARAARKNADIAERSLVAANRPYVVFWKLHGSQIPHTNAVKAGDPVEWDDIDYISQLQFFTRYSLTNQGKTPALIHNTWIVLKVLDALPDTPSAEYLQAIERIVLGTKVPMAIIGTDMSAIKSETASIDPPIEDRGQIRQIMEENSSYYFYGFILYSDIFGRGTYVTAQAFRYDLGAKGFTIVGGQEYNYDYAIKAPQPAA